MKNLTFGQTLLLLYLKFLKAKRIARSNFLFILTLDHVLHFRGPVDVISAQQMHEFVRYVFRDFEI